MEKKELLNKAPDPYIPAKLPLNLKEIIIQDPELLQLLIKATQEIGEYRGFLVNLINPSLLISPLISQEAVLSSKLEGTHATLEDLLKFDANISSEVDKDEIKEVSNYRNALFYALESISPIGSNEKKLPLSSRTIKQMHKILLNNVRGEKKRPGNFKVFQNYIVSSSGVIFTPLPPDLVEEYISNLEKYIHYEDFNILLQAAVIHCQFEMIHPFEDGNGRIGRLLIPLFLYYKNLLPLPTFYMSSYFNQNRTMYIDSLNLVSQKNDWASWFKYFLNGIIYSSNESTYKAVKINELYEEMKNSLVDILNSSHSIQLLDYMFKHPIFKAKQLINDKDLKIPQKTAYTLLSKLVNNDILVHDKQSRNRTFIFIKLINLL